MMPYPYRKNNRHLSEAGSGKGDPSFQGRAHQLVVSAKHQQVVSPENIGKGII